MKIGFFASHNGSTARAITKACESGTLDARPLLMISNNPGSVALQWAADSDLRSYCLNDRNTGGGDTLDREIANVIQDHGIDLMVCSGYMKLIGPRTLAAVPAILNVHPALLPKFGGQGMYGRKVHDAVAASGDAETGITIHLVDGEYDHGAVIAQKKLPLRPGDTAEDIEALVKAAEPDFYIETIGRILDGRITLPKAA